MDDTAFLVMKEQLELLIKAGRRCAYDLQHAADFMTGDEAFQQVMYERAKQWLTVFNPGDDGKNYRHRLHNEIASLKYEVDRLKSLCAANNIETTDENDFPF